MIEKNENLELRMYFFVPYNISDIQKGIQAGHCALEYADIYGSTDLYKNFVKNHKTWIILNGGTTNVNLNTLGTLNKIYQDINNFNNAHYIERVYNHSIINIASFSEPDLNNALSAICFIADERVFNYEKYPEFKNYVINNIGYIEFKKQTKIMKTPIGLEEKSTHTLETWFTELYSKWIKDVMGSEKNIFLRELIKNKKLA